MAASRRQGENPGAASPRAWPALFDRSGRVRRPSSKQLLEEIVAFWRDPLPDPPGPEVPPGDGHPVLVFPGFLHGDGSTEPLRRYLGHLGYPTFGWGLGRNLGLRAALFERCVEQLLALAARHGRRVSLVGVSLGGILARELARRHPGTVRCVVTLCTPFRLPTASSIEPVFRLLAGRRLGGLMPLLAEVSAPLAVPSTALYTRSDGIVAWQSCRAPGRPPGEAIEFRGHHTTVPRNPEALAALARALARSEEASCAPTGAAPAGGPEAAAGGR